MSEPDDSEIYVKDSRAEFEFRSAEFYKLFCNWPMVSEEAPEEYKKGCIVLPVTLYEDVIKLQEKFKG